LLEQNQNCKFKIFINTQIYRKTSIYQIFQECYSIKPIFKKNKTSKKSEFVGLTLTKLKNAAENQKSACLRTLGKNFNEHHSTIGKFLEKYCFSYHKRQKIPKYTEKQLKTMTCECRKLLQSIFTGKKLL
jgi:hypothetical protein